MPHPGAPPAIKFLGWHPLIASDRNKADFALGDKRTNEVHARAERFCSLALGEQKLHRRHRGERGRALVMASGARASG